MMRYYKGLGVGHIYIRLKADDPLLVDRSVHEIQDNPTLVDDNSPPPVADDGWTIEDIDSDPEISDSDEDDSMDKFGDYDDSASDRNSIQDKDSLDEDDILDLEYQDMYGDRCESDDDY